MANLRMAVVVRRDLQLTPGLLAAQVAHISALFVQKAMRRHHKTNDDLILVELTGTQIDWINEPYIVILACETPEELAVITKMAQDEKLPVHEWKDVIPSTVLEGRVLDCLVGIAIGPSDSDQLKKVTGMLPLY